MSSFKGNRKSRLDVREGVDEDIQYLSDIDYFGDEKDELKCSK